MMEKILNITNGDAFNEYFLTKCGGEAVPFREAMLGGNATTSIYSDEFIRLRTAELNVNLEEYRKNMLVYDALIKKEYSELCLWFGKDTFCQMNLLTLLAYLEKTKFSGSVVLNYIDDESFNVLETGIVIELGIYQKLYETIILSKQMPSKFGVLVPRAIELYFDYHSDSGALAQIVRDNADKEDMALVCLLLENSKEYGLSDVGAEELVKKYRQKTR